MKKSRTSLFRTLILSLVLLVTVFIIVIAWFSSLTEATASGLSVKASPGSGLEATFTPDVESSWKFEITDDTPKAYPLVTGSGALTGEEGSKVIDLFLPAVNKSTGEAVLTNNAWFLRNAKAKKDYFETNVYFRSTEQLDVAITDESSVTPKSLITDDNGNFKYDTNLSEFGNFSRDYIAGASRVGFYDAQDNLKFVWAPNNQYELKSGSEFVEIKKNANASGGMIDPNPEKTFGITGLPHTDGSNYYYMWEVKTTNTGENQNIPVAADPNQTNPQGILMRYDSTTNKFYAALDVSSTTQLDHGLYPVKLNDSEINGDKRPSSYPSTDYGDLGNYKLSEECKLDNYTVNGKTYTYIGVYLNGDKGIQCEGQTNSRKWHKLTLDANPDKETFFDSIDRFQILIEYDPSAKNGVGHMKVTKFAFYSSKDGGIGGGTIGTGQGTTAFKLENNQNVVLASPNKAPDSDPTYALVGSQSGLTSKQIFLNATKVKDEDGSERDTYRINPQTRPVGSDFTVTYISAGQYTFKHNLTGYYLYDSDGTLGLTAEQANATKFELTNGSDYTVGGKTLTLCRLQSMTSKYYLSINETGAFLSSQKVDCRIFISQDGVTTSNYTFDSGGTAQTEYKYLNRGDSGETKLTEIKAVVESWADLTPTSNIVTNLSHVSGLSLIRLTKPQGSEYYTGQIKIRIWVEGTDREAKTPLVNGIFNTQLVFNGTKVSA